MCSENPTNLTSLLSQTNQTLNLEQFDDDHKAYIFQYLSITQSPVLLVIESYYEKQLHFG